MNQCLLEEILCNFTIKTMCLFQGFRQNSRLVLTSLSARKFLRHLLLQHSIKSSDSYSNVSKTSDTDQVSIKGLGIQIPFSTKADQLYNCALIIVPACLINLSVQNPCSAHRNHMTSPSLYPVLPVTATVFNILLIVLIFCFHSHGSFSVFLYSSLAGVTCVTPNIFTSPE